MKNLLLRVILPILGLSILMVPASAAAWNPFKGVGCNQISSAASQSAVCDRGANTNPISGKNGLLIKIADFIAIIAGIAAVIMIIVGGIRYVVANGDSNAISSAKNTIIYALVGLIIIALSRTIIAFVVSKT